MKEACAGRYFVCFRDLTTLWRIRFVSYVCLATVELKIPPKLHLKIHAACKKGISGLC